MRRRHAFGLGVVVTGVVAGLAVWLTPRQLRDDRHLVAPEKIPTMARAALKTRMQHHGKTVDALVWAVLLRDDPEIEAAATDVLAEAPLSRPLTDDATELNALLPERFFTLQDQLRTEAQSLKAAAQAHNRGQVSIAYGQLSQTCVSCHQVYRHEIK